MYLVRTISNLSRVHSHNDSWLQDLKDLFRPEISWYAYLRVCRPKRYQILAARFEMSWSYRILKVGVNHGIFHVYHFWNFLIFKCTWVCSSSSSKNKNIFLNLSINSINSKMSIYLSISKIMCSSLFSRGNQVCARIANAKRYWRSLETQHYQQWPNALDLELARWPW